MSLNIAPETGTRRTFLATSARNACSAGIGSAIAFTIAAAIVVTTHRAMPRPSVLILRATRRTLDRRLHPVPDRRPDPIRSVCNTDP